MVLEVLLNPTIERSRAHKFLFVGFAYTVLACVLALIVFPSQSSIVSIFLTVLAVAPFMYHMLEREEMKRHTIKTKKGMFAEYYHIVLIISLLFAGMVLAYATLYVFEPESPLFELQNNDLAHKQVPTIDDFERIFLNNVGVLFICIVFSFFFGFGAIFVITFNAKLLGVAIGSSIIRAIAEQNVFFFFLSFLQYLPHGIFELSAYFIAGIAGSFLSFGILHKEYLSKQFAKTIAHTIFMFSISLLWL